jgi:hypothetical protein
MDITILCTLPTLCEREDIERDIADWYIRTRGVPFTRHGTTRLFTPAACAEIVQHCRMMATVHRRREQRG